MRNTNDTPAVNAGSMADIAFLLLIFFLATSMIPNDKGIARALPPPCPPNIDCDATLKQRNVFIVQVNQNDELMINNKLSEMKFLKEDLKNFIDNNGDKTCNYCEGKNDVKLSENPDKATISIQVDREVAYSDYIKIQDKIAEAYAELRTNYISEIMRNNLKDTLGLYNKARKAYPMRVIEN